jgi:ankyrin repeat protein
MKLLIAATRYDLKAVTLLLEEGAEPNAQYRNDGVPVWEPAYRRLTGQVTLTVETPTALVTVFECDGVLGKSMGGTPPAYEWITKPDPVDLVRVLLQHGARPNERDSLGYPLILSGARSGFTGSLRLMLDRGANANAIGYESTSLMEEAVLSYNPDTVRMLIQHGVDLNHKDQFGETPLTLAVRSHLPAIAEMLKRAGAR